MTVVLWALLGYAAGSVPSAYLAASFAGRRDALEAAARGAGETDAHLVLRDAGAGRAAAVAGVADVLKALAVVLVARVVSDPYATAACGIGAVAGHCWPPLLRRYAGRGLAAAAGFFLPVMPVEMTIGGLITLLGTFARVGGAASSVGFVAIPVLAWYRGQPAPYVLGAVVAIVLIGVRRLEGVGEDLSAGVPPARAVVRRLVFDVSAPPANAGRPPA
jgi:glycerol-3-phosphate acyltransferase PlsY